jgi:prophage regulatory protein
MPDTFLRVPDVCRIIGISRATLYEMMAKGEFPKPIKLFERRMARWSAQEIERWQEKRKSKAR